MKEDFRTFAFIDNLEIGKPILALSNFDFVHHEIS